MSFEIYLDCFRDGVPAPLPIEQIEAHFAPHIVDRRPWGMVVLYRDGGGGEVYVDGTHPSGLTVSRPGGRLLFDDLFLLMKRTGMVLYWPSETPSLTVADHASINHLPAEMLEAIGPATQVFSGGEIIQAIERG